MRPLVALLMLSAAALAKEAGKAERKPPCTWVDFHGKQAMEKGTLSPFWAQELIGAPFAREVLDRLAKARGPIEAPPFAIIDTGFSTKDYSGPIAPTLKDDPQSPFRGGDHGSLVANLIAGAPPYGVGFGKLIAYFERGIDEQMESILALTKMKVRLVNVSQRWNRHPPTPGLDRLSEQAIVVFASGNAYEVPSPRFTGAPKVLGVGALSPLGTPAAFSQSGEGVDILAPGEHPSVMSHSSAPRLFGGTSGAAPLVSGALLNVLALVPDLDASEAKALLGRTAVPLAREPGRENGTGLLNAYKLAEVAARLSKSGGPAKRRPLLSAVATYDFSKDAAPFLAEGKAALRSRLCTRQKKGFGLVQKAFLLAAGSKDPLSVETFREARLILVESYRALGLAGNADFYAGMEADELAAAIARRLPGSTLEEARTLGRALHFLPATSAFALLESAVTNPDEATARQAVEAYLGGPYLPGFVAAAYRHPSMEVRYQAISRAARPQDAAVWREALHDPDAEVRAAAARRLAGEPR